MMKYLMICAALALAAGCLCADSRVIQATGLLGLQCAAETANAHASAKHFAGLEGRELCRVAEDQADVRVHGAAGPQGATPDVLKVIEHKVEGSFVIRFSVKTDGTVYDVRTVEVTEGIAPLAKLWAETIRQWTFVKTSQPVTGIEYRRIYMYSTEDEERACEVAA